MSNTASRIVEGPALARALPSTTVPQFIRERIRHRPDALAMIDAPTGRTLTCATLDHQIGRAAAGLAAQGFRPGDTLLICSANSPEWVVVALGAMAAGGRVSGANPGYTVAELAQQLRDSVRSDDFVARFGGDEFVILLRNVSRPQARSIADKVLAQMRSISHVEQGHVFHLQCSIGVTAITSGRFGTHEVLAQADMACQMAKTNGRNRVEFYNVSGKLNERMAQDIHWTRTIRHALENNEFVLHYQPLMHIKTQAISHYEALLRLKTGRGLIGPQAFLPAVARFGLMAEIDRWVVEHAIRALAEFTRSGSRLRLSVNLTRFSFEDETFASGVRSLLREYDVAGDQVCFEITEQMAVRFAAKTDRQIAGLRDLGCLIAVDDFGTGYSSFSYLKRLPADYLKIDGSFIRELTRSKVDQTMVRMIGEVANAAGLETVAEYVETAAAMSLLEKYGIDYAQGFYIGRAVPTPFDSAEPEPILATDIVQ